MNRLPVIKAWIRERAATVYSESVHIDYMGGDPRFVINQKFTITCTPTEGAPYAKNIEEPTEEIHIKTFNSDEIENFLAQYKIIPKASTDDVVSDL